jgi:hypothetical protein
MITCPIALVNEMEVAARHHAHAVLGNTANLATLTLNFQASGDYKADFILAARRLRKSNRLAMRRLQFLEDTLEMMLEEQT